MLCIFVIGDVMILMMEYVFLIVSLYRVVFGGRSEVVIVFGF